MKKLLEEEGGKIGGKVAATRAASAAAIAKVLSGIEFPKDKREIVNYVENNKQKVDEAEEEVLDTIKEIPDKKYHNMVEVEEALGQIR